MLVCLSTEIDFDLFCAVGRNDGPIDRLQGLAGVELGLGEMRPRKAADGCPAVDQEPDAGIVVVYPGPEVGCEVGLDVHGGGRDGGDPDLVLPGGLGHGLERVGVAPSSVVLVVILSRDVTATVLPKKPARMVGDFRVMGIIIKINRFCIVRSVIRYV